MAELTEKEIWFMQRYFSGRRPQDALHLDDIMHELMMSGMDRPKLIVDSLLQKNVLDRSPDFQKVKITDYGFELMTSIKAAQSRWDKEPIIRVAGFVKDRVVIAAGERFKGNRILREMFAMAQSVLYVVDPYFGTSILDAIEDTGPSKNIRILTNKIDTAGLSAYEAFKAQFKTIEIRRTNEEIHDRYVVCDEKIVFHVGHSLKDLGTKDTQVNLDKDVANILVLLEKRWVGASAI